MATENIMMEAVKRGGDRQELHERLRGHSIAAARVVKEEGKDNDLLERIAADPSFGLSREEIDRIVDPAAFIGRCPQQVERFIAQEVDPIREEHRGELGENAELSV